MTVNATGHKTCAGISSRAPGKGGVKAGAFREESAGNSRVESTTEDGSSRSPHCCLLIILCHFSPPTVSGSLPCFVVLFCFIVCNLFSVFFLFCFLQCPLGHISSGNREQRVCVTLLPRGLPWWTLSSSPLRVAGFSWSLPLPRLFGILNVKQTLTPFAFKST